MSAHGLPLLAACIAGVGMLTAFQRPDWRDAPRHNARLSIRVVTESGALGTCLWFIDGRMAECEGLDEPTWAKVGAEIHELLLQRVADTLMSRRYSTPRCD